jgi:hypothetical protein
MLALLFPVLAGAQEQQENRLGVSFLETPELTLVWNEPLGFFAPHTIRTFTNSLAWQKRMFGWTPSEKVTVFLKDHSDYGHVTAFMSPRNTLWVDIAPLSHAFETYPASERMYSLMNHELVHIAQGDVANATDRGYRRLFMGKVNAIRDHPESMLYSYLTVPRFNVPRWYLEGGAVFIET